MDNLSKLASQGLHDESYFTIQLKDGSSFCEKEHNWSDMSEEAIVEYFGGKKTVFICKHDVQKIHIKHNHLETEIDVPEGHSVYQAVRSVAMYGTSIDNRVIGRVVGLVKDGSVVEERFIDEMAGLVVGFKP